ncbi:MAG: MBOAT family protein [Oscillospiraceae bacterium]|nr:MBOAT family protein [Oscillospiraceae bacterium]
MLFNSIDFLIFFPIVVTVYLIIPAKTRYIWLLLASYYFYMSWNAGYAILIIISTVTTWIASLLVYKSKNILHKKLSLAVCLIINLGILFTFKYYNFFIDSVNLFLSKFSLNIIENTFSLLLPVGISFYTFQALGYIIDVYRGEIKPEKNLFKYALFVSFFPQLVAGPIERSKNLLSQVKNVEKIKVWNYDNITYGFITMVWGMFIKIVIADRIAIIVNTVFDDYYMFGTFSLAVAAICFALQIYCDFMGYSTIAVGAARIMGFSLMDNFNTPYFATSISEFWRKWHISLSTWFRDYVYIPLGGNRCSRIRKYFNLFVTFTVSGLWHGANWTFVIWGALNGLYQIIGDFTKPIRKKFYHRYNFKTKSFSFKLGQTLSTFILIDFAWIFFRADSIGIAFDYIKRMFTKWDPWSFFNGELYTLGLERFEFNILIVAVTILFLVDILRYIKNLSFADFIQEQCLLFRWAVILFLVFSCIIYGSYGIDFDSAQFIYFQF